MTPFGKYLAKTVIFQNNYQKPLPKQIARVYGENVNGEP